MMSSDNSLTMQNWVLRNPDPRQVQELTSSLGISQELAKLLINRGMKTPREADLFLNPELSQLHNPFLLPNMEKAVLRVRQAIDANEKILVYGDRDADGVTSTAIVIKTLQSMGAEPLWTLPQSEGHGLHCSILEKFKEQNIKVLITADCGTSATEEVQFANSLGMDVIITDHHLPAEQLPPAFAIVNPNLENSNYPFKELAGCAVAFKFCYALMFTFNRNFNQEYAAVDLETTGLASSQDHIVELGAVCIRNFVPIAKFHTLVRPQKPISPGALAVHGITEEMVATAPALKEVFPSFIQFIGERTIIAHNAKFDLAFLQEASKNILQKQLTNPVIDTLAISRDLLPSRSHSLTSLAADFRIELSPAHRALNDCLATALIFQKLEELIDPRLKFFLEDQLELATLGTIADVAPLLNENRILVKLGIPYLLKTKKIGLQKLIEKSWAGTNIFSPQDISRWVTPLINAAGRLARADVAVNLLLTDKEAEAITFSEEILQLNEERRVLQKINLKKFFQLAQEQCDIKEDPILIVVAEGLAHGVTGIVASRMAHQYQKPVILLIAEEQQAVGSARSVPGLNIVHCLDQCRELLLKYGGHPQAAGVSLPIEHLKEFRKRMKKIVVGALTLHPQNQKIEVDMELQLNSIDQNLIAEISRLAPFGQGNPPPTFLAREVQIEKCSEAETREGNLQLVLTQGSKKIQATGLKMAKKRALLNPGDSVDILYQIIPNLKEISEPPNFVIMGLVQTKPKSEIPVSEGESLQQT